MSTSSPATTFPFEVEVLQHDDSRSIESSITVLDGWDRVSAEGGEGSVSKKLPPGLYTVRVVRAGAIEEQIIRHKGPTREVVKAPARVSAVPTFDTSTAHEYYSYTSQEWSTKDTRDAILGKGGRLFVFIRAASEKLYAGEDLAAGLRLLTLDGEPVASFTPDETQRDQKGWLALSAPAKPDYYVLSYAGDELRELPIQIFPDRNTQVFVSHHGRLRLATATFLLPKKDESFDPDSRDTQLTDSALKGLLQGRDLMPRGRMTDLLDGKFHNPMLGLLGAHLLLLRRDLPARNTLDIVLGNLDRMLPDSPDVQALRLLVAERYEEEIPATPFDHPPLLRAGLEVVLRHAATRRELVAEGSLVDRISTRLLVDSPWSSWRPVIDIQAATAADSLEDEAVDSWIGAHIEQLVTRGRKRTKPFEPGQIARGTGLPLSTVERMLRRHGSAWKESARRRSAAASLRRVRGIGQALERKLGDLGVRSVSDLASLKGDRRSKIQRKLGRFGKRLEKERWIDQAEDLLSSSE